MKVACGSPLVFAVEAIAASQVQALAQEQKRWQGRVFLPTLHALGDGHVEYQEDANRFSWQMVLFLLLLTTGGFDENGENDECSIMYMLSTKARGLLLRPLKTLQRRKKRVTRTQTPCLPKALFLHLQEYDIVYEETQCASLLMMELAHGTLEDHGKLAGDALLMVAWALASTLALLNEAGFIHGGLKPSDILWREHCNFKSESVVEGLNGWPLLTDFGSAQSFHSMRLEGHPVKSDEEIQTYCWTPAYAAPEVRHCDGKMQTMRSDMYSYAKTIQRISWGALPKVLQEICAKCLQEDPMQRPESFTVIAAALEETCPTCVSWGQQLWHEQQREFPSPALAHKHTKAVQRQALEVLRTQRMDRLSYLVQGRKTKQVIEPLMLIAHQQLSVGSPTEACGECWKALVLNPGWAVHPKVLTSLGNAEGSLGNPARQKELQERSLKILEGFYGQDHPEVAKALASLGNAEGSLGNVARQKELQERSLKILEGFYGQDHPEVAKALASLGSAEGALGNAARQKELQERSLKILEGFYGQDHLEVAKALASLGNAEGALGNAARQKELQERSLKILEGFYGQDHPEVAQTLTSLGNAEGSLGNAERQKA